MTSKNALLWTLCLATATTTSAASTLIEGVASVIDGDTLEIHGQRIRLTGIDAPESGQTCTNDGKPYLCCKVAQDRETSRYL